MTPYQDILIPTDGSDNARAAAAQGLALAKLLNAQVTVLSVVDMVSMTAISEGYGYADLYSYLEKDAEAAVDQIRQDAQAMGLAVGTKVARGTPANEIIEESKHHDLVVMGTLGRTGLAHMLMGSVAEKVVRFASCPVLVVRTPPQ
jgi:nucleotide-binding universal stress UspA family protein